MPPKTLKNYSKTMFDTKKTWTERVANDQLEANYDE